MEDKFVKFTHEEVEIVGEVTYLKKTYMEVQFVEPFCNWSCSLYVTGPGTISPERFEQKHKEFAQKLLIESYKKLKWMDDRIGRVCQKYDLYVEELEALRVLDQPGIKGRIEGKLRQAFFDIAFMPEFTGFQFSAAEKCRILDILEIYKLVKCKIYKT